MNQEKNSRPDATNNEALNRTAAVQSAAAAGEEPVRGKRRSRRSTSGPTRLRQAAELLQTAPAASPAASRAAELLQTAPAAAGGSGTPGGPRSGKPDGQRSDASKHDTAVADSGTNGPQPAGTPSQRKAAGILPRTAAEDDPRAWGDAPEDTSAWLREQRPPHWG